MEAPPARAPPVISPDTAAWRQARPLPAASPFRAAEVTYLVVRDDADRVAYCAKVMCMQKSLRPGGPTVFWELRAWAGNLNFTGKTWNLASWIGDHLSQCVCISSEDFIASMKSATSPNKTEKWQLAECGYRAHAKEYTCSTAVLAAWLLYGGIHFGSTDRRNRARSMLCNLVQKCSVHRGSSDWSRPPASSGLCDKVVRPLPGGACSHVRRLTASLAKSQSPHAIVDLLMTLAKETDCPAVKRWLGGSLRKLASEVDRFVFARSSWPSVPEGVLVMRGAKRARRIDEVVVRSVAIEVVRSKRSRTSIAYAKATGVMTPSSAGQSVTTEMANYVWSGNRIFNGESQLSMTYDMSFCSGKDMLAIGVYSWRTGMCMWLPPQVVPGQPGAVW